MTNATQKSKYKLVDTITNDEEDIRFKLYNGEIFGWEAAKELRRRTEVNCEKRVLRQERRIMRMGLTINALMEHIAMLKNNPLLQEKENNVVELVTLEGKRLAAGDKKPPTDNWLAGLKIGTIFVCEPNVDVNMQTTIQQEYSIEDKTEVDGIVKSVLLLVNLNEPEVQARVNPERFCKYYNWVSTLYEPETTLE